MLKFLLLTIRVTSLCSWWWGTQGWVQGTEGKTATLKERRIAAEDQNQHSHKSFARALVCSVPLTQSN